MLAHGLGDHAADHFAPLAFQHEEVGARNLRVVAEKVCVWRAIEDTPQAREHLELALHVVGARGDRAEGRSTQDELARSEANQGGEVRSAVWKLQDFEVSLDQVAVPRTVRPRLVLTGFASTSKSTSPIRDISARRNRGTASAARQR